MTFLISFHSSPGSSGLRWLHRSPLPLPSLCSASVQVSQQLLLHHISKLCFFSNWYPFTVVIFYLLSPIPTLIAKRHSEDSASNPCRELAWFLTTGIVISAFALPIVLARAPVTVVMPDPTPGPTELSTTTMATIGNTTTTTVVSICLG